MYKLPSPDLFLDFLNRTFISSQTILSALQDDCITSPFLNVQAYLKLSQIRSHFMCIPTWWPGRLFKRSHNSPWSLFSPCLGKLQLDGLWLFEGTWAFSTKCQRSGWALRAAVRQSDTKVSKGLWVLMLGLYSLRSIFTRFAQPTVKNFVVTSFHFQNFLGGSKHNQETVSHFFSWESEVPTLFPI